MMLTGCATVFSKGWRPLTVTSDPAGARVFIAGADSGVTPRNLRLRRTFKPIDLRVVAPGGDTLRVPVERTTHPTYFLNLLGAVAGGMSSAFGGASGGFAAGFAGGLLWYTAIDLATGAFFTPVEKSVHVTMPAKRP
jgi:hypothetical protein